ncbi:hypothetical protein ACOMHN_032544 [Nucella lapillus]
MSTSLISLLLLCLYIGWGTCKTKCFKNDGLGDVEGNVYYCYGDEKPECCEKESEFTCCESEGSKNTREQAQLWGTVAALVIIIGLLFVCCKNDYSLCNGDDRTLADRMGLSRRPEQALPHLSRPGEGRRGSQSRDGHPYPYSNLPPLPPMTPLPDGNDTVLGADRLYPPLPKDKLAKYDGQSQYNSAFLPDDD